MAMDITTKEGRKITIPDNAYLTAPRTEYGGGFFCVTLGLSFFVMGLIFGIFSSETGAFLFFLSGILILFSIWFGIERRKRFKELSEQCGEDVSFYTIQTAVTQLPLHLRHVQESIAILGSTVKIDVFLERYDFLIKRLEQLVAVEPLFYFENGKPSEVLQIFQEGKEEITDKFLDRCYEATADKISKLKTKRGKTNNAQKFYDGLAEYADKMTAENVEHLEKLYSDLLSKIEEPQIADEDKEECLQ